MSPTITDPYCGTSQPTSPSAEKSTPGSGDGAVADPDQSSNDDYPEGFSLVVILAAVFLNTFLAALDLGIVATAIPAITDEFRQLDHVGWYGSVYFLTIGVFSPFWTKLYKYCPTKKVLLSTIGIFLIGSIVAGTAQNSIALIVGRAIQGWGGAGILGGGFLLMHQIARPQRRPTFTGMMLAVFASSAILGPIIGGAFTSGVTWRWCFYVNLPVGGLSTVLILAFFRTPQHVKPVPATVKEVLLQLDFLGIVLLMGSLVSFTLALQWGGLSMPWNSGPVIATLVVWVLLTIAFVVAEIFVGERAMVPPRLIRRRETWANSLYGFTLNDANWVLLYYLPIYFQSVHGLTAIESGVANLPLLALISVGSLVGGSGISKIRHVQPIGTGAGLLAVIGAALIYTLNENSDRGRYMGYQVIFGLGVGIGNQLPMTAIQGLSDPADLTTNTGICLLAQLVSGSYFLTASQSIFSNIVLAGVPSFAPNVDPMILLRTGASEIREVFSGEDLGGVIRAYMAGIKGAFTLGLAGTVLVVLISFLSWKQQLPKSATKSEEGSVSSS